MLCPDSIILEAVDTVERSRCLITSASMRLFISSFLGALCAWDAEPRCSMSNKSWLPCLILDRGPFLFLKAVSVSPVKVQADHAPDQTPESEDGEMEVRDDSTLSRRHAARRHLQAITSTARSNPLTSTISPLHALAAHTHRQPISAYQVNYHGRSEISERPPAGLARRGGAFLLASATKLRGACERP